MSTRKKMILWLLISVGLVMVTTGALIDPFAIPFQDWEQLPQIVQDSYIERSNAMRVVKIIGAIFIVVPLIKIVVGRIVGNPYR